MTPFSDLLFQLRRARSLRQKDLAARLHLGSNFISALEVGRRDAPSPERVDQIASALQLTAEETAALQYAAKISQRHLELPEETSKEEYGLLHELVGRVGQLSETHIAMIRLVMQMADEQHRTALKENSM